MVEKVVDSRSDGGTLIMRGSEGLLDCFRCKSYKNWNTKNIYSDPSPDVPLFL